MEYMAAKMDDQITGAICENELLMMELEECASVLPGVIYMDPPDGGDVPISEQLRRMAKDAARYRWLREENSGPIGIVRYALDAGDEEHLSMTCADSAIDAAMMVTPNLNMNVIPLAQYVPDCERRQRAKARAKSFGPNKNCANANRAKHQQAVARYKEVMRGEWTTTTQIENRLGMGRASCTPNLRKWEAMGLMVRRKVGPADKWNRRQGYEWRFVQD